MAIEFVDQLVAGTVLVRSDIESQNYVAGSAGWIVHQDGSAEFNNVVIRGGTVVSGTALYYNGTPAAGTLFMSIASAAGTDSYGNAYVQGIAVYASDGSMIQLISGAGAEIVLQQETSPGVTRDPALIYTAINSTTGVPSLNLASGATHPGSSQGSITIQGTSGSVSFTQMQLGADFVVASKTLEVGTYVIQFGMTWQTPALGSGWVTGPSGGTVQAAQYCIDAQDNLILDGTVHTNTTTPATVIFNLPAAYRPKTTRRVAAVSNSGGTPSIRYLEINSNGNVTCNPNISTANTDLYLSGIVCPLGNKS